MSERRAQIHEDHALSKRRRCQLLAVARSTAYYRPGFLDDEDLALMRLIDEILTSSGRSTAVGASATSCRHETTTSIANASSV